ncbi:MAG TPA: tetratricopeptide repeat protein [Thermoanaerobaculia bacterium]|nr:tetratricopeptide repeat protein [Thermoanaerobaculia bacterium]
MATSRDQLLQSAEKHVGKGKLDQALKDYLRVLDENPKDIATLNRVGDLYVRMNRQAESIPFFTRIAEFYSRDGFFLKAIAIYKKINKIDPARLDVYDRLADLYHKQGLTQDARSQYQVLADHYLKTGKTEEAVSAYKKMAAVDPNDLRIQVKLADLYRSSNQVDQAVMQYGLIGSMLLRRGAHDEAAAVFQKALELSPSDAGIQKNLVRSLIAQKNPAAAIAILKAAPRTADSLSLLAEAQLEMGERGDAGRTAEQAIALDARHEGARLLLSRLRIDEGSFDAALAAIAPLVDAALAARDFPRAVSSIVPILSSEASHPGALAKLAEVRDAEGNPPEAARLRLALAHEEERRGDVDAAIETYRKVLATLPGQPDAAARLALLAPAAPQPQDALAAPATAEEEALPEIEVEIDDTPGPSAAPEPARTRPAARNAEEQEIETLVVEAEVFAKYGLTDKAIERLRSLVRRRPDLLPARERLVALLKETANSGLPGEARELAEIYRKAGREDDADALIARLGLAAEPAPSSQPPPASSPAAADLSSDIQFDEFNLEPAEPPAAEFVEDFGAEPIRFARPETGPVPAPPPPASASARAPRQTATQQVSSVDSDFVSYEELGSLLQDEMQRAGDAPPGIPHPAPTSVDDNNLFADEQQFFNLAEELEKELAEDTPAPSAPAMAGPEGEASLEEIFREFKKGVEQQLSAEDYETHFNLGIAYKEMGLVDEAIGEFQLASKDAARAVECCSMLGLCFLEKGMPQLAIKWYRKGLEAGNIRELETVGLLYDLGCVYQSTGDMDLAYRTFLEVYGLNTNYRDIVHRVRDLEEVRKG